MTNVPTPTFGPTGFVLPSEADILAGVQQDMNDAFGGQLNPGLSTPQGQLATSTTAIIGDANALFLWFTQQVDPAYSEGRMQDAIARIYFLERIPSAPTVVEATCRGLTGVVIPIGALASADDGNLYVCTGNATIGADGTTTANFACTVDGPIPCAIGALNTVYQAINGWDSITNADAGALGRNVETRANFEERRALSTAINSTGQLPAILGAVLAVEDVLDAYVTENVTASPLLFGGVWLAPNSLYVCVLGGDDQAIGEAIWSRKAPGCAYNGDTTVTVEDPSPSYTAPAPSYQVSFERPDIVTFVALAIISDNNNVPADAQDQIRDTIIAAFAGTDGGSRATIGTHIFASRYYGPVTSLGAWAQVITLQIGELGSAASIQGYITGNTLTVTNVVNGTISVGNLVSGTGIDTGTTVSEYLGGTGGTGTYTIYPAQTIGSGAFSITNLYDVVELNIDQAPAISAEDIYMQLITLVL